MSNMVQKENVSLDEATFGTWEEVVPPAVTAFDLNSFCRQHLGDAWGIFKETRKGPDYRIGIRGINAKELTGNALGSSGMEPKNAVNTPKPVAHHGNNGRHGWWPSRDDKDSNSKRLPSLIPDVVLDLNLTEGGGINTKNLATRLNFELQARNISKALFAEKVLNRGAKVVSDIILRPKPWHKLQKGRDVYLQVIKWLDLSEEDKAKVLEGNKPDFKVLEKCFSRQREKLTDEALDLDLQKNGKILTQNLALNIKYQLQVREIPYKVFFEGVLGKFASSMKMYLTHPKEYDSMTEVVKNHHWRMLQWAKLIRDDQDDVLLGRRTIEDSEDFKIPEEVVKLEIEKDEKIQTANVASRVYWELKVRRICKKKFAKAVLGKSASVLHKCLHEPIPWDRLQTQGRENFRALVAWLNLDEDEKLEFLETPEPEKGCEEGPDNQGSSCQKRRNEDEGLEDPDKKPRLA